MYEVALDRDANVQRCSEDESEDVPKITYNFLPISQVVNEPKNAIIGKCV